MHYADGWEGGGGVTLFIMYNFCTIEQVHKIKQLRSKFEVICRKTCTLNEQNPRLILCHIVSSFCIAINKDMVNNKIRDNLLLGPNKLKIIKKSLK